MVVKQSSFILKKLELFARPTTAARFCPNWLWLVNRRLGRARFGKKVGSLAGIALLSKGSVNPLPEDPKLEGNERGGSAIPQVVNYK